MSIKPGITREYVPVPLPDIRVDESTQLTDSLFTAARLFIHNEWVKSYVGIGSTEPFIVTDEVLKARQEQMEHSRSRTYSVKRDVRQIALQLGTTVEALESEFARQTVLDVGCGKGRVGSELARKAKASVIYLDHDMVALSGISSVRRTRLASDGTRLPLPSERFSKTLMVFSSLVWPQTPRDALLSLTEGLRVTSVGGALFTIPICQNVTGRKAIADHQAIRSVLKMPVDGENPAALKAWALQEHLLLNAIFDLVEKGYCGVTWSSCVGEGVNTGSLIENYSAIVDKLKPIPTEVYAGYLEYAGSFYPAQSGVS